MRIASLIVLGASFGLTANAQVSSSAFASGDFDGDGRADRAAWVKAEPMQCQLQVHLAARPDQPYVLVTSGGANACPEQADALAVRPAGTFTIRNAFGQNIVTFGNDFILSIRRPGGVRAIKYWSGNDFTGDWVVE